MYDLAVRGVIAGLALIGLIGVVPISLAEVIDANPCPRLGFVPACHLVAAAYGLLVLTALNNRLLRPWIFMIGWVPIFLFAAYGSSLELMGHNTCPQTDGGIPKCYLSLALALALGAAFLVRAKRPDAA